SVPVSGGRRRDRGPIAQRKSAPFTPERSLVRTQLGPPQAESPHRSRWGLSFVSGRGGPRDRAPRGPGYRREARIRPRERVRVPSGPTGTMIGSWCVDTRRPQPRRAPRRVREPQSGSHRRRDGTGTATTVIPAGEPAGKVLAQRELQSRGGPETIVVVRDPEGRLRDLSWAPDADTEVGLVRADTEDGRSV